MATTENKTQSTEISPAEFVEALEHKTRKADAKALLELFGNVTGMEPKMWGPSIIGYGSYHYKYESGREGDSILTGFSPRKANLVMYIMPGYEDLGDSLGKLGKFKIGKSCLYINKLADIDMDVLRDLIVSGVEEMKSKYEWTA